MKVKEIYFANKKNIIKALFRLQFKNKLIRHPHDHILHCISMVQAYFETLFHIILSVTDFDLLIKNVHLFAYCSLVHMLLTFSSTLPEH